MSVYKKLHQVQAATRSLSANADGQTGSARYTYVSGSKLLGVIRPLMDQYGLILTQEIIGIDNTPITYNTRSGEKTEMFTTCHFRFTWIDSEDGSTIVNEFFANGMNAWDKGLGSALTYAERYYLMKTFHVATDEDDIDALVKEEAVREPSQAVQARRKASGRAKDTQPTQTAQQLATAPPQPINAYRPVNENAYWQIVAKYMQGKPSKTGKDYRSSWIEATNAGPDEIAKFDHDCENYRLAGGAQQ